MDLLRSYKRLVPAFLAILLMACQPDKELIRNVTAGPALGTSFSIIYLTHEPLDLQSDIDSVFRVINKSMSTYIPGSDISKINLGDSTLRVDHMFREVFELSKSVYEESNGYFDPTVGVLVDAWGFGPGRQIQMDSSRVDSLLKYVGFDKVMLTEDSRIRKTDSRIRFDFNAVAKGYAIDRLGKLLDGKDLDNYLIEVGGELLAKGQNRRKKKRWMVGIDDPQVTSERRLKRTIYLEDRAMASSGNYRKFYEKDGIRITSKAVHRSIPGTG